MKQLPVLFLIAVAAFGQAVPTPTPKQYFTDNSGRPLNGGKLFTYFAGTNSPLATYTDSSATVANSNPVILDSSGRANVWLGSIAYKMVLTTSAGVTIWTVDNIPGNSSGLYVPISGGTVTGSLNVNNTLTTTNLIVTGTCTGCGGGGGGGVALPFKSVQFNDSGTQSGSANFVYDKILQTLTVTAVDAAHAAIAAGSGFIQADGGFLSNSANFNSVQAPAGGSYALSHTSLNYTQLGNHNGIPLPTGPSCPGAGCDTFQKGAIYYDTGASSLQVYNGSGWAAVGGGAGSPGVPVTSVQVNVGGAFVGSANLTYSGGLLTAVAASSGVASIAAGTGFIQSDAGFVATTGVCKNYNCLQSPSGGSYALSHTSLNYTQLGSSSGVPTVTGPSCPGAGCDTFHAGATYWDIGAGALQIYNGTAWIAVAAGTGVPGGPTTAVQINSAGAFAGSSNLVYASQLLTSIAASSAVAGMAVQTGFMQSDQGFVATSATCVKFNCLQAPTGGSYGLSHTSLNYTQLGNFASVSGSTPPVTLGDSFHAGAVFYDTNSNCLKVHNGTSFVCSAAGGVATLNGLSGAVVLAGTANQIIITPAGSTLTFSTPQNIATTSSPTFAAVTANGAFNSTVTGTTIAFQANSGIFSVNGQGDLSTGGLITSTSGVNVTTTTATNSIQTSGGFKGRTLQLSHPNSAVLSLLTAAGGVGYNIQRSLSPSDAQQFMIYNAQNGRYLLFANTSDQVGVNTSNPTHDFEVNGTTQTTNLIVTGTCTGCGTAGITSISSQTGPAVNISSTTPITSFGGANIITLACPTCVTTNTTQTISSPKTFSVTSSWDASAGQSMTIDDSAIRGKIGASTYAAFGTFGGAGNLVINNSSLAPVLTVNFGHIWYGPSIQQGLSTTVTVPCGVLTFVEGGLISKGSC